MFLYGQPTDMRRSFDGLQALTRHAMGHDPLDGSLYVFVFRRGAQMRVLYFDRSGFCVWGKDSSLAASSAIGTSPHRRDELDAAEASDRGD